MQGKKILFKVRRSRRSYLLVYLIALGFFMILIYLANTGLTMSPLTWIIALFLILSLIKYAEIHRIKDWWGITDSALIQSLGLLNKNIRHVGFTSISDMDINKPIHKRVLNYGDVNVRLFLSDTSINIKNISNPDRFVESFHIIISEHKKKNHGMDDKYFKSDED
jgi:hypothetical protein